MQLNACFTASSSPRHSPSRNASMTSTSSTAHSNHSRMTRRSAWRTSLLGRRRARRRAPSSGCSVMSVVRNPDRYSAVQMSSDSMEFGPSACTCTGTPRDPCGSSKSNNADRHMRFQSSTHALSRSAQLYRSERTGAVQPRRKKSITRSGLEQ